MEKGPSTYAEYWTSEEAEVIHFKHAKGFGFNKIIDYTLAAKNFANSDDEDCFIFVGKFNATYKFNPKTGEFIVVSREGKIVTYYRSSLRYFLSEFKKHGQYKVKGDW